MSHYSESRSKVKLNTHWILFSWVQSSWGVSQPIRSLLACCQEGGVNKILSQPTFIFVKLINKQNSSVSLNPGRDNRCRHHEMCLFNRVIRSIWSLHRLALIKRHVCFWWSWPHLRPKALYLCDLWAWQNIFRSIYNSKMKKKYFASLHEGIFVGFFFYPTWVYVYHDFPDKYNHFVLSIISICNLNCREQK